MSFQSKDLRVVALLDPKVGERYMEPMREDLDEVDPDHF